MKILRVITRLNIGGPSHQVQNLHLRLKEAGHECTLLHGSLDPGEGDHRFLEESHDVQLIPELTRPIHPLKDWQCFRKLCHLLSKEPFDILHTHTAKAGLLARTAAWHVKGRRKKKGFPELNVVHTYHGHVFKGYFNPILTQCFIFLEQWLSRHTNHLITLSPTLTKEISGFLKVPESQLDLVPLGLELEPFLQQTQKPFNLNKELNTSKKSWVGWVGRMASIKNPMAFLKLAKETIQLNPELGFVMIGDGPLKTEIEESIKIHHLENHVFLLGWKKDMPPLMASLNLIINTSFNEGTPVTLLEAMASGTPVLTSDAGGCRDILPKNEPASSFSLTNIKSQAATVVQWTEEKASISNSSRKAIVKNHSVSRLVEDLEALYLNT